MDVTPLDTPQQIGKLTRHLAVAIDGKEVKRGDEWFIRDRRGIAQTVRFDYHSATTGDTVVRLPARISMGRRTLEQVGVETTAAFPPGQNTLVVCLAPAAAVDVSKMSSTQIKAMQLVGELLDLAEMGAPAYWPAAVRLLGVEPLDLGDDDRVTASEYAERLIVITEEASTEEITEAIRVGAALRDWMSDQMEAES